MKKQLFIALLATSVMATSAPFAVFAETQADLSGQTGMVGVVSTSTAKATTTTTKGAVTTTNSAITTTGSAVTTTKPAIATTGSAVTTTGSAITGPAIDTEAKAPEVLAPITLTLEGAYKKMAADSPQVIVAKYTLDNEIAVGKGYSENLSNMNRANKAAELNPLDWGVDTSSKISLQALKKFATEQAPKNYEATMNTLKSQTYNIYYTYKYTESQVQVAKDNLTRTKSLYDSTMLQFKVGKVSKLDTLKAETDLNKAKDEYQLALNGMAEMKMEFNIFMGYNLHQPIKLSDELTALALPTKDVETSINEALINRNEMAEAKYGVEITTIALNDVKAYPSSSATYKKAVVSKQLAEEGLKSQPGTLEMDVRTKYMDMKQKHDAVQSGKVAYDNSKESSRLGQLQFDNGFITVNDLSGINLNTFTAQQAYSKAILNYNLSVEAYNLTSSVGVTTATVK